MNAKRKSIGAVGALVALLSLLVFVAACGDDGDDADPTATEPAVVEPTAVDPTPDEPAAGAETTIDVSLTEFVVDPSAATAPAGAVTFSISNAGASPHNLKVVATDLGADALPVDDDAFAVDEDQVDIRAASSDLDAGEAEDLTVELEAGSYVLICNVPAHYDSGMTIAFVVE